VGRLIISTAMSADGATEVGDWFVQGGEDDAAGREYLSQAEAMLLGRTTFEGLADYWSKEQGPWADLINPMPKLVVSRTVSGPQQWNGTAFAGEAAETVPTLKAEHGDLFMAGWGELARTLLSHDLVDELRFWVHPAVAGTGVKHFGGDKVPMRLLEANAFDSGVVLLRYEPSR
jgi:dihydrofolate reductase